MKKLAQLLPASCLSRAFRAVEARSPARRAASAAALRGAVVGILWSLPEARMVRMVQEHTNGNTLMINMQTVRINSENLAHGHMIDIDRQ